MDEPLSSREREVLRHILNGCQNKEIARLLNVSEKTVSQHLMHIYKKCGVHSRVQLYSKLIGKPNVVGDDFHALSMRVLRIEAILAQLGLVLGQCTVADTPVGAAGPLPELAGTKTTSTQ